MRIVNFLTSQYAYKKWTHPKPTVITFKNVIVKNADL